MKLPVCILGAGMTGLAAGLAAGLPVYEAEEVAGGICLSYHMRPGDNEHLYGAPEDGEAYRFEVGGGHWIFGGDPVVLCFINSLAPVRSYRRRSGVYFGEQDLYIPYPLQNNLRYLDREIVVKALTEMTSSPKGKPITMAAWIEQNFGPTLTQLFFGPFHERYTAGGWTHIAPQDAYKSPVNFSLVVTGAFDKTLPVGYNTSFIYPIEGLDRLAQRMAEGCQVYYGKKVVEVDVQKREIHFADGSAEHYRFLISTLPLNRMMEMTDLQVDAKSDPYTSVLVFNIGAIRGSNCPEDHWLYIPDSCSGFHRVGFYSNVDASFLPASSRANRDRVSIYVERAYPGSERPTEGETQVYGQEVVRELQDWGFIDRVEVMSPTWVDVAYTWSWPDSTWRGKALKALEANDIYQVGRYGRWVFQGIADSIREGLMAGAAFGK
jgi:protoporphyrinogen oxidase